MIQSFPLVGGRFLSELSQRSGQVLLLVVILMYCKYLGRVSEISSIKHTEIFYLPSYYIV